jgi:hypothetical protein
MFNLKISRVIGLVVLLAITGLAQSSVPASRPESDDSFTPGSPSALCDNLEVPAGNKVAAHVYAIGVQSYRWNGTTWVFV